MVFSTSRGVNDEDFLAQLRLRASNQKDNHCDGANRGDYDANLRPSRDIEHARKILSDNPKTARRKRASQAKEPFLHALTNFCF